MSEYFYDLHNLITILEKGDHILAKEYEYFEVDRLDEYDLEVIWESREIYADGMRFGCYVARENELTFARRFGSITLRDMGGRTVLVFTGRVKALYPVLNLVRDVVWFKLAYKEATLVHASGFTVDNAGVVVTGWQGTGKTMIALLALLKGAQGFLGDDMVLLKDSYVLPYPKPVKLKKPHLKVLRKAPSRVKLKLALGSLIKKVPVIRRRLELAYHARIHNLFEKVAIPKKAKIELVVFLSHGKSVKVTEADPSELVKRVFYQNLWERYFWIDRLITPYCMVCTDFNLLDAVSREKAVISRAFSQARCFEIQYESRKPEEAVEKILRLI